MGVLSRHLSWKILKGGSTSQDPEMTGHVVGDLCVSTTRDRYTDHTDFFTKSLK